LFRLIKERIGDHPNIVSLREVYFDEPPFYVEMDYAEGQDLASWCAAQGGAEKVLLETKLGIVAQIADALQAAHDAGVIHRDVKPANILVSGQWSVVSGQKSDSQPSTLNPQPSAKLTDFGIGQEDQICQERPAYLVKREGIFVVALPEHRLSRDPGQRLHRPVPCDHSSFPIDDERGIRKKVNNRIMQPIPGFHSPIPVKKNML